MTRLHAWALLAAALAWGCGGKLLEDGHENEGPSSGDSACDRGDNPFVGAWTCALSATEVSGGGAATAEPTVFDFSASDDGGLTWRFGALNDPANMCTPIPLQVAGSTATIPGQPVCSIAASTYITLTGGTFSISGCNVMSVAGLVGHVRTYVGTPEEVDYVDSDTGSCTRN